MTILQVTPAIELAIYLYFIVVAGIGAFLLLRAWQTGRVQAQEPTDT